MHTEHRSLCVCVCVYTYRWIYIAHLDPECAAAGPAAGAGALLYVVGGAMAGTRSNARPGRFHSL